MHKLDRTAPPRCLKKYDYRRDRWNDVTDREKHEIWQQLEKMQGGLCAYCESELTEKRHIEHFRQRSSFAKLSFEWENLFGSCNREDSCGKFKDKQSYDPNDLIKPDVDDPDRFLIFLTNGRIVPRDDLDGEELKKARETLRVFNLDHDRGPLRFAREQAVKGYLQTIEEFQELAENYPKKDLIPLLRDELEKIEGLPYFTVIRHAFLRFL
jgi:uncharacterized protein (TIGR02646 family)